VKAGFRYVAIAPNRIEDRKAVGPAWSLHEFLVNHQTDARGNVNYGKPFGYEWILARWPEAPAVRSLKRHMARLKANGNVVVIVLPMGQGMIVRVLKSAKWAPQNPPAKPQLPLFPPAGIVSISCAKAREKAVENGAHHGAKSGPIGGQKWPRKEVKKLREEKTYGEPLAVARSSPVENAVALDERRRVLADQALLVQQKFKSSG